MGSDVADTLLTLLDLPLIFARVSSTVLANKLLPDIGKICDSHTRTLLEREMGVGKNSPLYELGNFYNYSLQSKLKGCLIRIVERLQKNPQYYLDLKAQVVSSLVTEKRLLAQLFQKCGRNELEFIVTTGLWGGFFLGVVQMIGWLCWPFPVTLALGGAIVGYATDWFALTILFRPVEPIQILGVKVHGLFLQRQKEVSQEFASFVTQNLLTPDKLWNALSTGPRCSRLESLIKEELKRELVFFLPGLSDGDWSLFANKVLKALPRSAKCTHDYMQKELRLEETIRAEMLKMKSAEFERVLHPIFAADELTLILVGSLLGLLSGALQVPFY